MITIETMVLIGGVFFVVIYVVSDILKEKAEFKRFKNMPKKDKKLYVATRFGRI
jgi:hypothetical protein|tara:strand:- start:16 stop:177 length:162 start_codon:yes stop_codon:yes gene_type:complete